MLPQPAASGEPGLFSSQAKKKAAKKTPKKTPTKAPARAAPSKSEARPELPARTPLTAADQDAAIVPHIPGARFWADSESEFLRAVPQIPGPWLALSTGGEEGAYGAGLLGGWTKAGTRPEFTLVTGVSTGALIAPFAFLGPKYDGALRDSYTTINSTDVFEIGGKGESMLDTWPLRAFLAKRVTPELLRAIAAEHARGRRLFILTTNLDAGRPVAWDIGAIASRGDKQALDLVRDVMMAAISIPGAFPPGLIEVEANGRPVQEMHVDGGLAAQFYLAPDSVLASTGTAQLPTNDIYIIANMKLLPDFKLTQRDTLVITGRAVSTAIKYMTRSAIDRAYATAKRNGIAFHVSFIDQDFSAPSRGAFDPDYMKALYQAAFTKGQSSAAFLSEPPDLSYNNKKKVAH